MAESLAPIVFFAFRRPLETLQSLYTLSRCPEAGRSKLYVFCDGPRSPRDEAAVRRTRDVIRSQPWCGSVELIESEQNRGLARSVIDGVTRVCEEHGRVIVVEDDLLIARGFLKYMNEALDRYAECERVMTVTGHTFDIGDPQPRAVFLPDATSWSWATWSRAWRHFEEHPTGLERLEDPAVRRRFNIDDSYDYAGMLRAQLAGQIDSWAIRWWWSVFNRDGLGLFPCNSLVKNIGSGPLATHTVQDDPGLAAKSFDLDNEVLTWPAAIEVDSAYFEAWKTFLRDAYAPKPERLRIRALRLMRRVARAPKRIVRIATAARK
jgi:hypothetical protein